ncbi:hypothetical protein BDA96_09G146200 [Sorghum bicolor]|uniref:Uncharacterized protein n=1 Tax=Sorghum bicolor TaxID=4558 RepID=A0A921QAI0_SORBI|nr:hypothetical protein BDA96_09G146200 [Sorghum bicolor]
MLHQVTLKQSWAPTRRQKLIYLVYTQLTAISILFTVGGEPGII